jgi:hypothetical protein
MKIWPLILSVLVLCAGCAAIEEAYVLDREFGRAQMESWDKMIVYPDYRHADQQPAGVEGIHAEAAMEAYHWSFSKRPTETNVIQFGVVGD